MQVRLNNLKAGGDENKFVNTRKSMWLSSICDCSICMVKLEVGDKILALKCKHYFH